MKGKCFLCQKYTTVQEHHIFGGACRKKSEKYNAKVLLCVECHTGSDGVHNNAEKMLQLRQYGQLKVMEEQGWSIEDFRKVFYKNYL